MNDEMRAHLVACGVPELVVKQVEALFEELGEAVGAEEWRTDPAKAARFLAWRLECNARVLRLVAQSMETEG